MEIYMCATTATTVGHADPMNSTAHPNVQGVPDWAPDIAYIPTTTMIGADAPFMPAVYGCTTTFAPGQVLTLQQCVVRKWDARHFCLPMHFRTSAPGSRGSVEEQHTNKGDAIIKFSYRAVGELSR